MRRYLLFLLTLFLFIPAAAGYVDIAEVKGFLGSRLEIVWNTNDERWVLTFTEKELQGMSTIFLTPKEMKRFRVQYQAAKKKTLALSTGQDVQDLETFVQSTHLHPTKLRFHGKAVSEELKWLDIESASTHFVIPLKYEDKKILDAFEAALNKTQKVPKG